MRLLTFIAILWFGLSSASAGLRPYKQTQYVMGTLLEITLYQTDAHAAAKLFEEAFSISRRLDDLLSNYKADSEVNRFNAMAGSGYVPVSPELYEFLEVSKELSRKTGGVFDITIGPLIKIWQESRKTRHLPSPKLLKRETSLVGERLLLLKPGGWAQLARAGMFVDTGGVGKGYAVDGILEFFRKKGVNRALVNFGHSSIGMIGSPLQESGWRLLLRFPDEDEPRGVLELKDTCLSVSSSMSRSFELGGKRFGDIIDPRTGVPVTEKRDAVVLSESATVAEALSKLIALRGLQTGQMQRLGAIGTLFVEEGKKLRKSASFPALQPLRARN